MNRTISSALISVYHKEGLEPIIEALAKRNVQLYSTGGTQAFITKMGVPVTPVEDLTDYPSIFDGRVKTLHPKVFGGILHRRSHEPHREEAREFNIPPIDLVIVDLYPFEDTVAAGGSHEDIIEKIDIGGISLIRAAAKNYEDVLIISSKDQYSDLLKILGEENAETDLKKRSYFATAAFDRSSQYDTAIFQYMNRETGLSSFKNF
jgi:phosphoribosylaminoimidazolecarboxamide formyltransferase/IMP cyclohydrolase